MQVTDFQLAHAMKVLNGIGPADRVREIAIALGGGYGAALHNKVVAALEVVLERCDRTSPPPERATA